MMTEVTMEIFTNLHLINAIQKAGITSRKMSNLIAPDFLDVLEYMHRNDLGWNTLKAIMFGTRLTAPVDDYWGFIRDELEKYVKNEFGK